MIDGPIVLEHLVDCQLPPQRGGEFEKINRIMDQNKMAVYRQQVFSGIRMYMNIRTQSTDIILFM